MAQNDMTSEINTDLNNTTLGDNIMSKPVLGVIVGNRGFFPDHLCEKGYQTILKVLEEEGIGAQDPRDPHQRARGEDEGAGLRVCPGSVGQGSPAAAVGSPRSRFSGSDSSSPTNDLGFCCGQLGFMFGSERIIKLLPVLAA